MLLIRRHAHARAGLVGNPSDGYHGKTISLIVPNFRATVVLYEWVASKLRGRRVRADYKKLMPVAVAVVSVLMLFFLSTAILDIRDLSR